jgi:NAD(P)H-hydrate epimerase
MVRGCDGADGLAAILRDPRFNAVVLGPALGVHAMTRTMVMVAVEAKRALVLDADALTSFEGLSSELRGTFAAAPTVMTPHDGEFSRLFREEPDVLRGASKLERARRAAAHMGAVMVLKGPDTVIAAPDGRAAINENGNALPCHGGFRRRAERRIAGLMAKACQPSKRPAPGSGSTPRPARFRPGLIAEDLPEQIPAVLREFWARRARAADLVHSA